MRARSAARRHLTWRQMPPFQFRLMTCAWAPSLAALACFSGAASPARYARDSSPVGQGRPRAVNARQTPCHEKRAQVFTGCRLNQCIVTGLCVAVGEPPACPDGKWRSEHPCGEYGGATANLLRLCGCDAEIRALNYQPVFAAPVRFRCIDEVQSEHHFAPIGEPHGEAVGIVVLLLNERAAVEAFKRSGRRWRVAVEEQKAIMTRLAQVTRFGCRTGRKRKYGYNPPMVRQ